MPCFVSAVLDVVVHCSALCRWWVNIKAKEEAERVEAQNLLEDPPVPVSEEVELLSLAAQLGTQL